MTGPLSADRRRFLGRALARVLAASTLVPIGVVAQERRRMDPQEREQFRRALRERGAQQGGGGERLAPGRGGRGPGQYPGDGAPDPRRRRMSDDEREQLRRQLRERGRRRD